MNIKSSDFINTLHNINQIFKGIYNSGEKFQNIWNVQDGKLIMHHKTQLPSYIEVNLDSSSLVNAKGIKTAKGLMYDEFLKELTSQNLSINSIKYFNTLKEIDKNSTSIEIKNGYIEFNNEKVSVNYEEDYKPFDNKEDLLLTEFILDKDLINKIISYRNKPFNLIFDFDNHVVCIDEETKDMSYINVKISLKFLPYLIENNDKGGCNVKIKVYETQSDYMYDLLFEVDQYKIDSKNNIKPNPISVKYGIRILEL